MFSEAFHIPLDERYTQWLKRYFVDFISKSLNYLNVVFISLSGFIDIRIIEIDNEAYDEQKNILYHFK